MTAVFCITIVARAAIGEDAFPRRNGIVAAVEKASPAVVNISTEKIVTARSPFADSFFDSIFEDFFRSMPRPERRYRTHSLGSGVIIDMDGYIVTNEHVVRKASEIRVTMTDESEYVGELVSSDPRRDIAIIKIDAPEPLPYLKMGTAQDLMVGETVIAVGNPFGLQNSVTTGVISQTNRSITLGRNVTYERLIQTDALINPGNSGGPLLNINGEIIGINLAVKAEAQGIGFAVPIDDVRSIVIDLLRFAKSKELLIGIHVQPLTPDLAAHLRTINSLGLLVSQVDAKSPAAEAGITQGDIITTIDNRPITDPLKYYKYILGKAIGDTLELDIVRGDDEKHVQLTVVEAPKPSGTKLASRKLGITTESLTPEKARELGLPVKRGVLVIETERGGPARRAGIQLHDVIVQIERSPVNDLDDLAMALEPISKAQTIVVVTASGNVRSNIRIIYTLVAR